jgi:Tfp pilus assembly protein PilZ
MDISTCGVFVAHGLDVRMDESVEVSLLVADHSDGLVEAMGRVAWINGVSGKRKPTLPQGFGVEFVTMKDESLDLVRKFIAGIAKART